MLHLPAEIAAEITSAWLNFVRQKPEPQASAVSGGNAGTQDVPRMPCRSEPQEPGPPSEPMCALMAAIGAVAKLLTKAEITWCTYGIESPGHLVHTRSSSASDCEFLFGKLWKPACNGQHSHISVKDRMAKC